MALLDLHVSLRYYRIYFLNSVLDSIARECSRQADRYPCYTICMLIFNTILLWRYSLLHMHIGDLERNNGFTASRRYVIFPFRYAPRTGRSLRRGLNGRARVCYGFLDAIACSLASPRMNFAIKAASEAPTYFLFLAPLPTYSLPALPFQPSPPPLFAQIQSLVYSRGISLPHSSSALLTSAAIARS